MSKTFPKLSINNLYFLDFFHLFYLVIPPLWRCSEQGLIYNEFAGYDQDLHVAEPCLKELGQLPKRRVRVVCWQETKAWQKRGKLNGGALYFMVMRDDCIHPKAFRGKVNPKLWPFSHSWPPALLWFKITTFTLSWSKFSLSLNIQCFVVIKSSINTALCIFKFSLWVQGIL